MLRAIIWGFVALVVGALVASPALAITTALVASLFVLATAPRK